MSKSKAVDKAQLLKLSGEYLIADDSTADDLLNDIACWVEGINATLNLAAMGLSDKQSDLYANADQVGGMLFNAYYLSDMVLAAVAAAHARLDDMGGPTNDR